MLKPKVSLTNQSDYYSALNRSESAQKKVKQGYCVACYTVFLGKAVPGYSVSSQMSEYRLVA
ncbi:MAG: hypothetical protein HC789_04340 [Microcoleus sp. CSU_2_2]|nr:hypothetical protein [Microcoleus sp. SU_5_3]NJS09656.1 hypothetical protein [Microcoleus sp. CSU_2_2]